MIVYIENLKESSHKNKTKKNPLRINKINTYAIYKINIQKLISNQQIEYNTIHKMDLMDIYRTFHPTLEEYIHFKHA